MNYSQIVQDLLETELSSQAKLAKAAGTSQSTIGRILNGDHEYPRVPTAKALEELHKIHCQ